MFKKQVWVQTERIFSSERLQLGPLALDSSSLVIDAEGVVKR